MSRRLRKRLDRDEQRVDHYQPIWSDRLPLREARREAHYLRTHADGAVVLEYCPAGGLLAGGQWETPEELYRVRSAMDR